MRMESGEVALIPVEDLDMDNMFVDAPDAIANAIYASPAVFDMAAAESQFNGLELATATYDDGFGGGGNAMPEWVSNTSYSVSDNSNVDGDADTVQFSVVAAKDDAAKFFIWNGQDIQSIYKSDGSYFEEADFTAGVDASQIYVSNYVDVMLDVVSLGYQNAKDLIGMNAADQLSTDGAFTDGNREWFVQIGDDIQVVRDSGSGWTPHFPPQLVTNSDDLYAYATNISLNIHNDQYNTAVKDAETPYVLYSSTFSSNEDDAGGNQGDGSSNDSGGSDAGTTSGYIYEGDVTYGNIEIPFRFSSWNAGNLYEISDADQNSLFGQVSSDGPFSICTESTKAALKLVIGMFRPCSSLRLMDLAKAFTKKLMCLQSS